ncbi:hypothetical protein WN51_13701 [Melipona quadrifasciata]|uniref:Uncharacterized protein n=1 Tax=Melipona quadrifasciata TaxID=166423 RepID=A0A0N0U512_9HYME|nr:hypothetical protein WN51_13701 [Melipona quadrifasciata]
MGEPTTGLSVNFAGRSIGKFAKGPLGISKIYSVYKWNKTFCNSYYKKRAIQTILNTRDVTLVRATECQCWRNSGDMGADDMNREIPSSTLATIRGILVSSLSRENLGPHDLQAQERHRPCRKTLLKKAINRPDRILSTLDQSAKVERLDAVEGMSLYRAKEWGHRQLATIE